MNTTIALGEFWRELAPFIMTAASAVVMFLLNTANKSLKAWTGMEMEARYRDTLHSAAVTGIHSALARAGKQLDSVNLDTRSFVVASAVNWIITSGATRAVDHFGLTPESLGALVDAKLSKLLIDAKVVAPPLAPTA